MKPLVGIVSRRLAPSVYAEVGTAERTIVDAGTVDTLLRHARDVFGQGVAYRLEVFSRQGFYGRPLKVLYSDGFWPPVELKEEDGHDR